MPFGDNFNRADGPLGASWTVTGNFAIVAGQAVGSNYSTAYVAGDSQPGAQDVSITIRNEGGTVNSARIVLKANTSSGHLYHINCQTTGQYAQLEAYKWDGTWDTSLGNASVDVSGLNAVVFRATYSAGYITTYVDGAQQQHIAESSFSTQDAYGFQAGPGTSRLDAFNESYIITYALAVSVHYLGTLDDPIALTLTGTSTAWTSGVPGSPTFTVSAGSLSQQAIFSSTLATAIFTPPADAQTVTVTDPSTGKTDTIIVVPGHYVGAGGAGGSTVLPQSVVDWLTLQASHAGLILTDADTTEGSVEGTLLKTAFGEVLFGKRTTVGTVDVSPLDPSLLYTLWRLVNGQYGSITGPFPEPSFTTLDAGLGTIDGKLDTLVTGANWNLAELLYSLGGNPVVSHQDIVDALGSLGGSDLTPVLDAIAATRGDTTTSLATLLSSLAGIRTTHTYSLGDVKDWVDALPHGEAGPTALAVVAFIAALALAIPTGGGSIAAEAVAVGAGPLLDIATLVEVVSILGELAGIASSVESIRDSLSPSGALTAPVWPGEANVTLGTPHVLADQLYIVEPMDGVIISVTTAPSKTGLRQIGGALYDYGVGEIAFETDSGHIEMWQYLGFRSMIATPKSMARAAGARFRVLAGASGTVTPWTSS